MKNFADLSPEELKKLNKSSLIMIIGSLQDQLDHISNQLNILTEQIALMNQRSFGRKTERADQLPYQMSLFDGSDNAASAPTEEPEVTEITVSSHTRKKKSRRDDNLDGLPARIFEHKLSNEELKARKCSIVGTLSFPFHVL